ncbi:MAG: hypothetical protein JNL83_24595 [Myxococcales bacterium]|nr:hypothetical protein [Myxococcales bacterium]
MAIFEKSVRRTGRTSGNDFKKRILIRSRSKYMDFSALLEVLKQLPAMIDGIGSGTEHDMWWVKFRLNTSDAMAWRTIQELGHILNYLSVNDRLSTVFKPVSPPPYMNGGPATYLSWVIEGKTKELSPEKCAEWLRARLPNPIDDLSQWDVD